MYIELTAPQRIAEPTYTFYDSKGGQHRPTWLIRTSDWQKVPGHEATDGYHTLSYCWEQSGELYRKPTGEFGLLDQGQHRLTRPKDMFRDRKTKVTELVTYDYLLQTICRIFRIHYLWYDKICIDQTNKEEKKREIKQMHLIYSNACYTLALVPEINIDDPKDFDTKSPSSHCMVSKIKAVLQMQKSLWFKRSWTLEELMMSTRMLVVGRNTHFWSLANIKQSNLVNEDDLLSNYLLGYKHRKLRSVNQVLRHAHFRTSTKEHDKIFALANIFEDRVSIDNNYDSDIKTLVHDFYRQLIMCEISVMFFGSTLSASGKHRYVSTMTAYDLPSWSGVAGLHSSRPIGEIIFDNNDRYSVDKDMQLCIKARSCTIRPSKYSINVFDNPERALYASYDCLQVITSMDYFGGDEDAAQCWSQQSLSQRGGCFASHYWKPSLDGSLFAPILPLSLTEECEECTILGVIFNSLTERARDGFFEGYQCAYFSPVIKKSTEDNHTYKAIGMILLKGFQHNEPRIDPRAFLDKVFDQFGCRTQGFCIK